MESLGQHLKSQRELRQVDISEIAESTKVNINYLYAIENNEWEKLPCRAFARGFILSYARALGIDEDEVILMYLDEVKNTIKHDNEKADKGFTSEKRSKKWLWISLALLAVFTASIIINFLTNDI